MKQSLIPTWVTILAAGFFLLLPFGDAGRSIAYGEVVAQVAQADETGEEESQSEASKGAEEKLNNAVGSVARTWDRVSEWIMGYVNILKSKVDKVFGFEKGEGSAAFFGSVLYFAIILVILFVLKFIYNIISDTFTGMSAKKKYKKRR